MTKGQNNPGVPIKAVIFDLDGTLIDSEPNYFESDKKLLKEYDIDFTEEMGLKYVGISSLDMIKEIKQSFQIAESLESLMEKKNHYYLDIARENTKVFPEMFSFLRRLKAENMPMAIASGSSVEVIELLVSITGIASYFQLFVSAEEVAKGKPAPDIFLETARRLRVPPENCLVLEDSQYGVEAAKQAGMYCISFPFPPVQPLPASFQKADVLYKKGMAEFSAEHAFAWVQKMLGNQADFR